MKERLVDGAGSCLPYQIRPEPRASPCDMILALRHIASYWPRMDFATALQPMSWDRMAKSIDKVMQRLERAASALASSGVDYAVIGGNAVAAWVSGIDESAVRNTRGVGILLRREDTERARLALESARSIYRRGASPGKAAAMDVFLDGPGAGVGDALHILWAGEKVIPDAHEAAPQLGRTEPGDGFSLVPLTNLVRMKLFFFRNKDRMNLRGLISVGLVETQWPQQFLPALGTRLQAILDDPERKAHGCAI